MVRTARCMHCSLSRHSRLAACAASYSEPQTIDVTLLDYKFVPDHLIFEHDVHYRLHLENHGKETHEFTAPTFFASAKIDNPDVLNRERTEIVMQPGETKDVFLTAPPARHIRSALRRPRLERHGRRHHRQIAADLDGRFAPVDPPALQAS